MREYEILYSEGRVRPDINEFDMLEDGYDMVSNASGVDDYYGSDGVGEIGGNDFYNAFDDSPDGYLPDAYEGADGDDYDFDGDNEYSNFTLWKKEKRKKFGKKLSKGFKKLGKNIGTVGKAVLGLNQPQEGMVDQGASSESRLIMPQAPQLEPEKEEKEKKGLSTGAIVGIGAGVVLLGVLVYFLTRPKKS